MCGIHSKPCKYLSVRKIQINPKSCHAWQDFFCIPHNATGINNSSIILFACTNAAFIGGSSVKELEKQLAEHVGVKHCISCANGTDALQLASMAWNIEPGDVVFVPDLTYFSSGEIVSAAGATAVKETFCIFV